MLLFAGAGRRILFYFVVPYFPALFSLAVNGLIQGSPLKQSVQLVCRFTILLHVSLYSVVHWDITFLSGFRGETDGTTPHNC